MKTKTNRRHSRGITRTSSHHIITRAARLASSPDEWVQILGHLGFSGSTISRETACPLWKVWKILRQSSISLRSYRRGESDVAQRIIQHSRSRSFSLTSVTSANLSRLLK